jgi:hypothetical protein
METASGRITESRFLAILLSVRPSPAGTIGWGIDDCQRLQSNSHEPALDFPHCVSREVGKKGNAHSRFDLAGSLSAACRAAGFAFARRGEPGAVGNAVDGFDLGRRSVWRAATKFTGR